ncbi:MAG: N-acetylmuramoyl-L-alanine amidase [Spirochaetes bacterium]|nr:N-acetylmuramoyl-L-alanine amidase [Spirochaetota bacterium]
MNRVIFIIAIIGVFFVCRYHLFSQEHAQFSIDAQPPIIQTIIDSEKNIERAKGIIELIHLLDEIYKNIPERILSGEKLTIYIDPCHGMVNGHWSAKPTGRHCINGISEEVYSLMLIRKLYARLSNNPHIKIVSSDDYLAALKGERNDYKNQSFRNTIKRAYEAKAQIIISQHLNNVHSGIKATGTSNIPGIHIVYDSEGKKYLENITQVHKGFLTLYNRLDVSGFSRYYAYELKKELISIGMHPNGWQMGAVADDRFIYFIDFPISLIYETGFISNPDDLSIISDPHMQEKIAHAQYDTLLSSVKEVFGIDISENTPKRMETPSAMFDLTLVKLSRIALFYMQAGLARKACDVIDLMRERYGNTRFGTLVTPYYEMKQTALLSEHLYEKAMSALAKRAKNKKQRQKYIRMALNYLSTAKALTRSKDFYDGIYRKYADTYREILHPGWKMQKQETKFAVCANPVSEQPSYTNSKEELLSKEFVDRHYAVRPAEITRPIIFAFEEGQSLKEAIQNNLAPHENVFEKLYDAFIHARADVKVKHVKWSPKKKRNITVWKNETKHVEFRPGIYIVRLNNNLEIVSAKRVSRVYLNPDRYQNHLYLKNSHFAHVKREKSL